MGSFTCGKCRGIFDKIHPQGQANEITQGFMEDGRGSEVRVLCDKCYNVFRIWLEVIRKGNGNKDITP